MMEEEEEGQYDDIAKYEDASSEDEQNIVILEEPKSASTGQDGCVTEQPSDEKTEFAKTSVNGYDSMNNTESESAKENEELLTPADTEGRKDQAEAVPDKSE